MALTAGTRLGAYEVTTQIGAGGMGEVYRATDGNLKRSVAIKVLPASVAGDADRLARFQREAEVLAALNHPNIAAIYGLEKTPEFTALVMELVDGDDLSSRIARGAIPVDEALPIARQIADALDAAHEQNIIHRDLKPANIKIRADGTVKVLDFGLAKAMDPVGTSRVDAINSPTVTAHATQMGMILGTAAYMAPEQAKGKPVDRRADIWAFGVVLYEMLTGRRAFDGDDISEVLASVLKTDPDLSVLPVDVPPSVRRVLRRCLQKDPTKRLRDIGDARLDLADGMSALDRDAAVVPPPPADRRNRERFVWAAVVAALTLGLAASLLPGADSSSGAAEMRLEIVTPPTATPRSLAISPDGRTLTYVATFEGQSRLWLRSLESGLSRAVPGTDGAEYPFWSPDSQSIAFFADAKLRRVAVDGGSVQTLVNAGLAQGGTWNQDNVILYASLGTPITRIPATGGQPVQLPGLAKQGSVFAPHFLPDGRRFLYFVRGTPEVRGVYVGQLDATLEARRLLDSDTGAIYASSGHLLFVQQGRLVAQIFNPDRLELAGKPFPVAEGVSSDSAYPVTVSHTGSIAYRGGSAGTHRQFVWLDRSGRQISQVSDAVTTTLSQPSLSPDGRRVAFYRAVSGNTDVWLLDVKRRAFSRFTSDPAEDFFPVWSPDGSRIIFSSNRRGAYEFYQKSVSGDRSEEVLLSTEQHSSATDWSRDGRTVLFTSRDPAGGFDIWALPLDGKPFPVVQTAFDEQAAQFSPDGHWIAYQSNESGLAEIYVRPFPGPGDRFAVSISGGTQVRWGRDAKELFYVARDSRLMAAPIQLASNTQPDIGTPVALFPLPIGGAVQQGNVRHTYMLSIDRRQFLVATAMQDPSAPITVILNWKAGR